jgi:hypothetical protein
MMRLFTNRRLLMKALTINNFSPPNLYKVMRSSASSYTYSPIRPASQIDGQFRLLLLLPGLSGTKLICSLHHTSFKAHLPYEALSYSWDDPNIIQSCTSINGSSDRTYIITIGGQDMEIGRNLYKALLQIRDEQKKDGIGIIKILWVDAICIDQKNNEEKSEQIMIMARIYSQATRVLMWLGEDSENVDLAFDTIEELSWTVRIRLAQCFHQHPDNPVREMARWLHDRIEDLPKYRFSNFGFAEPGGKLSLLLFRIIDALIVSPPFEELLSAEGRSMVDSLKQSHSGYSSILISTDFLQAAVMESRTLARYLLLGNTKITEHPTFMARMDALREVFSSRRYWGRLWVLQEVLHAREAIIMCGKRQMNFTTMVFLHLLLWNAAEDQYPSFLRQIGVDDPEDRLQIFYALESCLILSIDASYSTCRKTLEEAVIYYKDRNSSDPRDSIYALLNIVEPIDIEVNYNKPVARVFTEATISMVRANRRLDILCIIGDDARIGTNTPRADFELPSWVPDFANKSQNNTHSMPFNRKYYNAGGAIQDLESSLVLADIGVLRVDGCFYGTVATSMRIQRISDILRFLENLRQCPVREVANKFWASLVVDVYDGVRISRSVGVQEAFFADVERYLVMRSIPLKLRIHLESILFGRTLCMMTERLNDGLVVAPCQAEVGDRIFVARGSGSPFILRPIDDDANFQHLKREFKISTFYRFLGATYVHGIMDGEVTEKLNLTRQTRENEEEISEMSAEELREEIVYLV